MFARSASTSQTPQLIPYQTAINHLLEGQLIAYPTEAVYGIGCDPINKDAVEELLRLKGRCWSQGLILAVGSLEQAIPWIKNPSDITSEILKTWPGPITWVFPKSSYCPSWISGETDKVAIRFSAHSSIRELTAGFGGAIVSTSANPHKQPPSNEPNLIRSYFPNLPITEGSIGDQKQPSRIFDALTGAQLR